VCANAAEDAGQQCDALKVTLMRRIVRLRSTGDDVTGQIAGSMAEFLLGCTGVHRTFVSAAVAALACLAITCAHPDARPTVQPVLHHVTPQARLAAIRRAQVWAPTNVPEMDLKAGPQGSPSYAPDAAVECEYRDKKITGNSPKFICAVEGDHELKVKYGIENGEVYAEVAATRLFWALGFPTDAMYAVRVDCHGCSDKLQGGGVTHQRDHVLFNPAAIERRMSGTSIEVKPEQGWAWPELDLVDPAAGGAPQEQRDALKLLAVMVQHSDSKPEQQRIVCPGQKAAEKAAEKAEKAAEKAGEKAAGQAGENGEVCADPVMMVNDLGQTFGSANTFNRNPLSSVNFERWSRTPVWTSAPGCVGNLPRSHTGSLENPRISDAGRRFLADLLVQLTDTQLHDLFEVARFPQRKMGSVRAATANEWVDAFKRKRAEIVNRNCPS
jgi:hypothetical protein